MKALNYFPMLAVFFWMPGLAQKKGDFRSVQPDSPAFPVYDWNANTTWEEYTGASSGWEDADQSPDETNFSSNVTILSYVDLDGDLDMKNKSYILQIGDGPLTTDNNPYLISDYNILVVRGDFSIDNHQPLLNIEENGILVVFGNMDLGNMARINNSGFLVISKEMSFGNSPNNKPVYTEGENGLLFLEEGGLDVMNPPNNANSSAYTFAQLCGEDEIDELIEDRESDLRRLVLDALCDFVLSGGNVPLPVELLAFDARAAAPAVEISWSTATELNNDYFTLERSVDGINFEVIATVAGMGTTNETSHYEHTDGSPLLGIAYYRLSQTDFDGTHEVLGVRAVNFIPADASFSIYPNPLRDSRLRLQATGLSSGREATFRITDLTGRTVYELSFFPELEVINQEVEIAVPLRRGIYLAELQQSDHRFTQKLVVE